MSKVFRIKLIEYQVLVLLLCATNLRGLEISRFFYAPRVALAEAIVGSALVVSAVILMRRAALLGAAKHLLASSTPVVAFLTVATASIFWSIETGTSLIRVTILLCTTAMSAYLAVRYSPGQLLDLAARYFAALVALSVLMGIAWPALGIMNVYPYFGSWQGLFWHRNYLGSTMALGAIILLLALISSLPTSRRLALVYCCFYVAAIALVFLSQSATGVILLLALHAFLICAAVVVRLEGQLRPIHYWAGVTVIVLVGATAYVKLNALLGMFHRDSTLTGRVTLWKYLFSNVFIHRPILGHGFGALWSLPAFQLAVRDAIGWMYPVFIGDNGFVDIALHLGLVGLLALVGSLIWCLIWCLRWFLSRRTILSATPLLVLLYLLITDVTLSYFLEVESFTWLVTFMFVFSAVMNAEPDWTAKMPAASDS